MLGVKAVPAIGGIAHYVEELGAHLAQRGHEVTVYCRPHYLEGPSTTYRGMQRVNVRGLKGKHLDALTHTLASAVRALGQGFDIVHVHGVGPGCVAPLLRLARRSRTVVTVHGIDWQREKWSRTAGALIHFGARVANAATHAVTAVSESVRDEYERNTGRKALYISTGVVPAELIETQELAQFDLRADEYILAVARLVPEKGLHYLVEAFEGLDTPKKLVIAGDARDGDIYAKRLLARAGDRIRFLGYVTGRPLAELYSNAYLFVQPSDLEGLSISVLEALSYGRCVLASDIAPNVEALGGCGYTFRAGDVQDLREKMLALLDHPADVAARAAEGREYILAQRSWETTTDHFEALYNRLLGR